MNDPRENIKQSTALSIDIHLRSPTLAALWRSIGDCYRLAGEEENASRCYLKAANAELLN